MNLLCRGRLARNADVLRQRIKEQEVDGATLLKYGRMFSDGELERS